MDSNYLISCIHYYSSQFVHSSIKCKSINVVDTIKPYLRIKQYQLTKQIKNYLEYQ